eukprot:TRINITY_DN22775_c0_g5_i1.p1 TRINITY_DN22775_c0_g5~~TRINITY_DN22775_c0_g5_i1.p1  ORF type:complete len:1287 (-),score=253.78 TRINITY_DN22775_c0_g5_i1:310-4032(-)
MTFGFGLPLMRLGAKRPLEKEDVPPIRQQDCAKLVVESTVQAWVDEQSRHPKRPSMLRALVRLYRGRLLASAFWCFLESVIRIAQPLLLKEFLRALGDGSLVNLYCFAGSLVVASVVQAIIHHQLFFLNMVTGWNSRIGVSGALHWKLLRLRPHIIHSGSADCYNLISNDCQRFDMALPSIHFGWGTMVDIIAVAVILAVEIGWLATLSGVGIVLVIAAVMTQTGKRFAKQRKITAGITDERMKLTAEVISAITSVKVYCWEKAFIRRIGLIRHREHGSIFKRQTMVSLNGAMYFSLTPLACLGSFLVMIGQGQRLTLPTAYTVLSLIFVLRTSVGKGFNFFISQVPELVAAVNRFTAFLALPEVPSLPLVAGAGGDGPALQVADAAFSWPAGPRALSGLSLQVRPGELLVVSGPVGCGKSALLQALLGDLDMNEGSFKFAGSIGYAPQTPWITAGSLRSNVLIGADTFDQAWYDAVIHACGLEEDLRQLGELGDETEIGDRGVNLSGGQRARVGLARAVHARPQVALLDDPLAAVDPAVAAHLVRHCLRGKVLSTAAVVLCTHQENVFALADTLLLLDESGRVRACGPPHEVAQACGFVLAEPVSLEAEPGPKTESGKPSPIHDASAPDKSGGDSPDQTSPGNVTLVKPEDKKQGAVEWRTYVQFAKLAGFGCTAIVFALFLCSQVLLLFSNYWIGVWAASEDQEQPHYFWVFVGVAVATIIFACARSITFYHTAMSASSSLHAGALQRLLHTHLGFFTANPPGRILNRFSGDLGNVDELLSQTMHEVLDLGFIGLGTVVVVCITVPPMIPCFILIFWYMLRLRRFVVKSMTELKRLDSTSRSPIFDWFNTSLKGVTSIRAFGRQSSSQDHMVSLLQGNAEAWFWWMITNRFIGFRLDIISAAIMGIAAFGGAALRSFISSELVGLAIVNTISLSGLFQYMVRQSAQVESFMTSFERLLAYAELPGEPDSGTLEPDATFPSHGAISVSGLRMRYREDLPEVLKGVDFECGGGIKVGVCGRTGSGKSSLFMALARLTDNTAGKLCIDGVDGAQLPLQKLRSCIAWVPQEPSFFSGSVRLNLDPFGLYSDADIDAALRSVEMAEVLGPKGPDAEVAEGGSNFSIGERQLLSLARALLQRRKILCMDEAFANVDFATDAKVQAAIRTVAKETGATVIVVAHRMKTLADSDRLIVMGDGIVLEHGSPKELLELNGAYATMASHAQLADSGSSLELQSAEVISV